MHLSNRRCRDQLGKSKFSMPKLFKMKTNGRTRTRGTGAWRHKRGQKLPLLPLSQKSCFTDEWADWWNMHIYCPESGVCWVGHSHSLCRFVSWIWANYSRRTQTITSLNTNSGKHSTETREWAFSFECSVLIFSLSWLTANKGERKKKASIAVHTTRPTNWEHSNKLYTELAG